MSDLTGILAPGMLVAHPGRPDWGTGMVQSVTGRLVTVMWPDAGKVVIDGTRISLLLVATGPANPPGPE